MNLSDGIRILRARAGDRTVFVDNRINVRGRGNMTLLPDFFLVTVYNASPEDLAILEVQKTLTIYSENSTVVCTGEIEDIYQRTEGTNDVCEISISDGQTFWESKINRTVGGGAAFSTTLRNIITGAKMGSFLAEDKNFVRSQTFSGRLADVVANIARGVRSRAFISENVLHVVPKKKSEIIVSIEENDLIADPRFATGVCIVKTEVQSWPVGMLHSFRNRNWRLVTKAISADNFEGDWQIELTLVNEDMLDADGMEGG